MRNRARKTVVKNVVKRVRVALANKSAEEAQAALSQAIPVIDKAAAKGALHHKTASRKISRLSSQVHALVAKPQPAAAK
jgi:small subunit ribosomal protein S20